MRKPFVEAASSYRLGDAGGHRRRVVTIDESQNGMTIVGPVPVRYRGRAFGTRYRSGSIVEVLKNELDKVQNLT